MKRIITLLAAILITTSSFAQGRGINYKAVIKDDSGNVLASTFMNVQFTIHQTTASGTIVYQEDHIYTTDANGLVILNIGSDASPIVGIFADIDWGADLHFLQTTIVYSGGTINFDATQFMAVPYALHAANTAFKTVDNITSNIQGDISADSFVFGSSQMDDNPTNTEDNSRMFFNKAKSAFRAGNSSNSARWDNNAIGIGSTAFGSETLASGNYSTAMGLGSEASGENSTAMGKNTYASAENSLAIGWLNVDEPNALFMIGNGYYDGNFYQSNALTVFNDGTITAPSFDMSEITDDKALITKEYLEANTPSSTGLEYLDQTDDGINNGGYRLNTSRSGGRYLPIGENAVDLSDNWNALIFGGATGKNSVTMGYRVKALGNYSTAMGNQTTASGNYSMAIGAFSLASGSYSIAMGNNTAAYSYGETVFGTFSTAYTPSGATNYNSVDRLFVIGNGIASSATSDAFIVLKNGTITAPSLDILDINNAGNKALVTKEYTDANYLNTTSNLVPIAYGTIESNANVLSGTGNFTASINAGVITISVNNENMLVSNTSCLITPYSTAFRAPSIIMSGGNIEVRIFNSSGNLTPVTFQFVIYKL